MKGLQSSKRKFLLTALLWRPGLDFFSLFARPSPVIVAACCITKDLAKVEDSEQGDVGSETTFCGPGGGGQRNPGDKIFGFDLSILHLFGGCNEGASEGGDTSGVIDGLDEVCPGSEMLLLKESLRESLPLIPSLSIMTNLTTLYRDLIDRIEILTLSAS